MMPAKSTVLGLKSVYSWVQTAAGLPAPFGSWLEVHLRAVPEEAREVWALWLDGRRGNLYDNAKAESFMKTLKHEEVHLNGYKTFQGRSPA